jgi:hypothetical protein
VTDEDQDRAELDELATSDDDVADDDTADDDSTAGEDTDVRDPDKQRLSQEAAKWRRKFREAEARLKEMKDDTSMPEALRAARLEAAFLREVLARDERVDLETAWDLANARGYLDPVKLTDDGAVEGMVEAFDRLLGRYPYLADDEDDEPAPDQQPAPKIRPPGGRASRQDLGVAGLRDRFPALRRGRR